MEPNKEPSLNDLGTRYSHLSDYRDALESCISILKSRGLYSTTDKQKMIKFEDALEVVSTTIDTYSGLKDSKVEFSLYKQLNTVPEHAEDIESKRGTPLV